MPTKPDVINLGNAAVRELLFLALRADKLDTIFTDANLDTHDKPAMSTFHQAAARTDLTQGDVRRIVNALTNLQNLKSRFRMSEEDLLQALGSTVQQYLYEHDKSTSFTVWEKAAPAIIAALKKFDRKHPLFLTAKTEQLAYVEQNVLTQFRLVTELRPVFDDSGEQILAAVATHELVVDYFEASTPRRIQFALDVADIEELKRLCERAERKVATIKTALRDMPWPTASFGETSSS
jgi:hypothetical protein